MKLLDELIQQLLKINNMTVFRSILKNFQFTVSLYVARTNLLHTQRQDVRQYAVSVQNTSSEKK